MGRKNLLALMLVALPAAMYFMPDHSVETKSRSDRSREALA
jgi:hypothetical protein